MCVFLLLNFFFFLLFFYIVIVVCYSSFLNACHVNLSNRLSIFFWWKKNYRICRGPRPQPKRAVIHCAMDPSSRLQAGGPHFSRWIQLGQSGAQRPGSRSGSPALGARSAIHATRTVTSTHTAPRVPYNSPVPPTPPPMGPASTTTAPLTTRRVHLSYYV